MKPLVLQNVNRLPGYWWQLTLCCLLCLYGCFARAEAQHTFSIPSVSLAQALVAFVSQSGAGVVVADDVDTSLKVNGVSQKLSVPEALAQMLVGLQLYAERSGEAVFVIRRRLPPAESPVPSRPQMEELVVTGTYIKGGLQRKLNPLVVIDSVELENAGRPSLVDLVATLPMVSGTENQSNQFHNANAQGTANINLRGLGVSRTLVLLNGKRLVSNPLAHSDGQTFADINTIPAIALEQVDILLSGAGATYGSDAMAGVVNFMTRRDIDGVELQASGKYIDESDGDWDLGILWGGDLGNGRWQGAINYSRRGELTIKDRSDIIDPSFDIPALGRTLYSVSAIGNPGAFIPIDAAVAADGVTDAEAAAAAGGRNNYVRDPECEVVGGLAKPDGRCGFQYVDFDNLVEEEERWQLFAASQHPLASRFGSDASVYTELSYARTDVPNWKTSPSFPALNEVDASRYLPADHPGLVAFLQDYPELKENDGDSADFSGGAVFVGRPLGVAGPAGEGSRIQDMLRILLGLEGDVGLSYDLSLAYGQNRARVGTPDFLIDRWQAALQGFGGAACTGKQAGANGCLYYNPFSSAIPASATYRAALANRPALIDWMQGKSEQTNSTQLLVADALFSGDFAAGHSRRVNFAFGVQYRQERLKVRYNDLANLALNPGDESIQGVFNFIRGGYEDEIRQSVSSVFGELAMPLSDSLSGQFALRYEKYDNHIGQSFDPKLSLLWDLSPALTLRASASTSFRAPSLNQNSVETGYLRLIGAAFSYKSVDRLGNPDLDPERAFSSSLGLIWTPDDHWLLNLDYWRFDIRDAVVQESANAIVNTVLADPDSSRAEQVVFDEAGNISRIISRYINGPDILVDGIDIRGEYRFSGGMNGLGVGWNLTYLRRYDVEESDLLPAFSADGRLNAANFVKSLPKWQGKLFLNYNRGLFNARLLLSGIGSYKDDGLGILDKTAFSDYVTETEVEAAYLWDLYLRWRLPDQKTVWNFSVLNLTDREPPTVREDMRFDTTRHNAFGRMLKIGFEYRF